MKNVKFISMIDFCINTPGQHFFKSFFRSAFLVNTKDNF